MKIFKVLNEAQLKTVHSAIQKCNWVSGEVSAEGAAKLKKRNKQIISSDKNFYPILNAILEAHDNVGVKAYTYFKKLIDPRVARYVEGDHYDWHIDTTLLVAQRTDLSFTIFLSPKEDYEGGEISIASSSTAVSVKGNPGEMLVYPSGLL